MKDYLEEAGNIYLSYYIEAADELGVKYEILQKGMARFQYQDKHWYIIKPVTPLVNTPAKILASRKHLTTSILHKANLSVPIQKEVQNVQEAKDFFDEYKDIVIKPKQSLGGKGVSIKPTHDEIQGAFNRAYEKDKSKNEIKVLCEKYFSGVNVRLLTLGNKVIGVVKRDTPRITGDGKRTIEDILKEENTSRSQSTQIPIDEETQKVLKDQKLDLSSIPKNHEIVYIRYSTNLAQGGHTEECSEKVHSYYKEIAVKAIKELDMELGGVDLIVKDINKPDEYIINEINHNPGLKMHYQVDKGKKVKVAIPIIEYLIKNH